MVSVMMYVMVPPGATGSGESSTATEMSATSVMVMLVVTELFAVLASAVSEVTEAVLVAGPKSGAVVRIERRRLSHGEEAGRRAGHDSRHRRIAGPSISRSGSRRDTDGERMRHGDAGSGVRTRVGDDHRVGERESRLDGYGGAPHHGREIRRPGGRSEDRLVHRGVVAVNRIARRRGDARRAAQPPSSGRDPRQHDVRSRADLELAPRAVRRRPRRRCTSIPIPIP